MNIRMNKSEESEGTTHEMWGFEAKWPEVHPNFATNTAMEFHCHTSGALDLWDTRSVTGTVGGTKEGPWLPLAQ